jgi:hypothetical protein
MMFEQFAAVVRDWQSWLSSDQARECAEGLRRQVYISDLPDEIPLDAVLAAIAKGGPAPVPDGKRKNQLSGGDGPHLNTEKQASSAPKSAPAPKRQAVESTKATSGTGQDLRGRPSKRAQALVREQHAKGRKRGEDVQAAADLANISERTLIAAASSLGVRHPEGAMVVARRSLNRLSRRPRIQPRRAQKRTTVVGSVVGLDRREVEISRQLESLRCRVGMSAIPPLSGGKETAGEGAINDASDPTVWTGRALQAKPAEWR